MGFTGVSVHSIEDGSVQKARWDGDHVESLRDRLASAVPNTTPTIVIQHTSKLPTADRVSLVRWKNESEVGKSGKLVAAKNLFF